MLIELDPDTTPWYANNITDFWKKQDRARLEAWREELRTYGSKVKQLGG